MPLATRRPGAILDVRTPRVFPPPPVPMPSLLRSRLGALPVLLALVLSLPACDSGNGGGEEVETDQIVNGVNFTRLFAPPTDAETAAVRADWAGRNTTSSAATIRGTATVDGASVTVVEHTVTATGGGTVTHYGVIRVPSGASGELPILMVHHGGDDGFSIDAADRGGTPTSNTGVRQFATAFPTLASSTVQVFPVYRSETISTTGYPTLGGPFTAGGTESPWDYDVDDSIALLSAVQGLALFASTIDEDRVGAIGLSRGANTAALQSIRDTRVDALVDYYGPTDFVNPGAITLATVLLAPPSPANAGAFTLPGAQFLFDNILNPLRNADGSVNPNADYAGARLAVVRRSASAFQESLPNTQVHHHFQDGVVPVAFSQAFEAAASQAGGGSFEVFYYGTQGGATSGVFHAPELSPDMQASIPRVQAFFSSQLSGAAAREPALALAY